MSAADYAPTATLVRFANANESSVAVTVQGMAAPVVLATGTGSAAGNAALMQAAFDRKGSFRIVGNPGDVFYYTAPVYYDDDTTCAVDPGVILRQPASNSKRLLDSKASQRFLAGGDTVVLTWSAGTAVNVAKTAHGRTRGQMVWIWGVTPSTYVGIHRVADVVDANNYTIYLPVTPASVTSGTAKECLATTNAKISGGVWDYDYANNAAANSYNSLGLCLHGTAHCIIEDVDVINCSKYCVTFCATYDCHVNRLTSTYNQSDGIKVYGPTFGAQINCVTGRYGDDVVSIQAAEALPLTYPYQLIDVGGDIRGVVTNAINATTISAGGLFTLYNKSGLVTSGIYTDGVDGYSSGGTVWRIFGDAGSKVLDVHIQNIGGQCGATYAATMGGTEVVSGYVENWKVNPKSLTHVPLIQLGADFVYGKLTFDKVVCDVAGYVSTGGSPFVTSGASGGQIVFSRCENRSAQDYTTGFLVTTGGAQEQIIVSECDIPDAASAVYISGSTNAPHVVFRDNNFDGAYCAVKTEKSCTISTSGNRFNNLQQGIVRCEATSTCTLKSDGTNLFSGTSPVFTIGAGTFTFNPQGWDLSVDPSATGVNRGAGNFCKNAAAAAGTLVQNNLIVCDATGAANSWKQLSDTALTY